MRLGEGIRVTPDRDATPPPPVRPAPSATERCAMAVAAMAPDVRVGWARRRLEGRALRAGLLDARNGRAPGAKGLYLSVAAAYARAYRRELVRRWPPRVVARVERRYPWLRAPTWTPRGPRRIGARAGQHASDCPAA